MTFSSKKFSWTCLEILFLSFIVLIILTLHQFAWVGLRGFVQGDLGLLLNVPWRILQGQVPYRDFYAGNYSPGSYYFHVFLFWLFGPKAHVLSLAQGLTCGLSAIAFHFLIRPHCRRGQACLLTTVSLFLWIPLANIPFPAIYGTTMSLALVWVLKRWLQERRRNFLLVGSLLCGLMLSFKISLGIFMGFFLLWIWFYGQGHGRALKVFSWMVCGAMVFLLRSRFNVATVTMFLVPVLLLLFLNCDRDVDRKKDGTEILKDWAALIFPAFALVSIWAIPFLWVLGASDFIFHFWTFPGQQASVLYYPPSLPFPQEVLTTLGFDSVTRTKDLSKLWFYFPLVVTVLGLGKVLTLNAKPDATLICFFVFNVFLQLQQFPTIDLLHFQWSAVGALLLFGKIFFASNRWRWPIVGFSLALGFSLFWMGHYGFAKKKSGGYLKSPHPVYALHIPAHHAYDLNEVIDFLTEHLEPDDVFWNPPGNFINFVMQRPIHLPSDYFGPPYIGAAQRMEWLAALKISDPKWVVMTRLNEKDFGFEALQRNFPEFHTYVRQSYEPVGILRGFMVFKKRQIG